MLAVAVAAVLAGASSLVAIGEWASDALRRNARDATRSLALLGITTP